MTAKFTATLPKKLCPIPARSHKANPKTNFRLTAETLKQRAGQSRIHTIAWWRGPLRPGEVWKNVARARAWRPATATMQELGESWSDYSARNFMDRSLAQRHALVREGNISGSFPRAPTKTVWNGSPLGAVKRRMGFASVPRESLPEDVFHFCTGRCRPNSGGLFPRCRGIVDACCCK